jgi:hypothetical protein
MERRGITASPGRGLALLLGRKRGGGVSGRFDSIDSSP